MRCHCPPLRQRPHHSPADVLLLTPQPMPCASRVGRRRQHASNNDVPPHAPHGCTTAAALTTLHPHSPSEVPSPATFAVHHRRQTPPPTVSPPPPPPPTVSPPPPPQLPSPRFDCCICTSPPPRRRHPTQPPPPLNAPTHHCLCEPSQFSTTAASLSSAATVEIHLCRHRLAVAMLLSIAVSINPVQMPPPPLKGFAHCGRWKVAASGGRGWR